MQLVIVAPPPLKRPKWGPQLTSVGWWANNICCSDSPRALLKRPLQWKETKLGVSVALNCLYLWWMAKIWVKSVEVVSSYNLQKCAVPVIGRVTAVSIAKKRLKGSQNDVFYEKYYRTFLLASGKLEGLFFHLDNKVLDDAVEAKSSQHELGF